MTDQATTEVQPERQAVEPVLVEARALIDLPAHGVKAGRLLVADAVVVSQLVAAGEADDHPDAVAYAKTLTD